MELVIERKIKEELEGEVPYELGRPLVFFQEEREEHGLGGNKARIFAVGYEATFAEGEIILGKHHDKMERVDVKTFNLECYFTSGRLSGDQRVSF